MIYHVGKHRGKVTIDGIEVPAVLCDDVAGYAVAFKRDCNGMVIRDDKRNRPQLEIISGEVLFIPMGEQPEIRNKPQGIEAKVCDDITERQSLGIAKYGKTVAASPLDLRAWLQHAYEECLDQSIYLRRAIDELDSKSPANADKASTEESKS